MKERKLQWFITLWIGLESSFTIRKSEYWLMNNKVYNFVLLL